MRMLNDNIPIILVTKLILPSRHDERVVMGFWCPFCVRSHTHGLGVAPTEWGSAAWCGAHGNNKFELLTHRLAHCGNPDSPFKKTGYYLYLLRKFYESVVTPAEIERFRKMRESWAPPAEHCIASSMV